MILDGLQETAKSEIWNDDKSETSHQVVEYTANTECVEKGKNSSQTFVSRHGPSR